MLARNLGLDQGATTADPRRDYRGCKTKLHANTRAANRFSLLSRNLGARHPEHVGNATPALPVLGQLLADCLPPMPPTRGSPRRLRSPAQRRRCGPCLKGFRMTALGERSERGKAKEPKADGPRSKIGLVTGRPTRRSPRCPETSFIGRLSS